MNAIIYTYDNLEYESIRDLVSSLDVPVELARPQLDGHKIYERYDLVIVCLKGAEGMEVVMEYNQRFKNTELIWISDDEYFAGVAMRAHIHDFIVRPYEISDIKRSVGEAVSKLRANM
ncbi:MAG: hypothetical protein IKP88_03470 [Lachnospiraceae bacterium]|nr:hypothetical protein [Lachnospiraceae bacterium]